ncbi:MAG: DUF4190 domain-containing protein [Verrucomicrobiota bacterium]
MWAGGYPEPPAPPAEDPAPQSGGYPDPPEAPSGYPEPPAPPSDSPAAGAVSGSSEAVSDNGSSDETPTATLGIVALCVGVLNTITFCGLGFLLAPAAVLLGHMALAKAKNSPVKPAPGQTFGLIGLILGYAGILITIIGLIVLIVAKPFEAMEQIKSAQPVPISE